MATLQAIAEGIETRLDTITGLRPVAVPLAELNPPYALILPGNIEFHRTMGSSGGQSHVPFVVHVVVATGSLKAAHESLYAYCDQAGASSVRAAIEGDRTLGGIVDDTHVSGVQVGFITEGHWQYFGARFDVLVLTAT